MLVHWCTTLCSGSSTRTETLSLCPRALVHLTHQGFDIIRSLQKRRCHAGCSCKKSRQPMYASSSLRDADTLIHAASLVLSGNHADLGSILTLEVPRDVTVQDPHPWIVGTEADYDVRLLRDGEGVPTHGVVQIPGRGGGGGAGVAAGPPAYYLDGVACCTYIVRFLGC